MKLLWLDDLRDPFKGDWLVFCPFDRMELNEVIWVKSYGEFTEWITEHGLPDGICFDNDLGQDLEGRDCAKWLVEYCLDNRLPLPCYNIQSSNYPAKEFIHSLLKNYEDLRNK